MTFPKGRIPLYLQLYWTLREEILLEELTPGNRVPTITDLHERYGVSQGTVRQSLDLLEQDGLISLKAGSGIFVNKDITTMMWSQISSIEDIVSETANTDNETLSQGWVDAPNRIQHRFADQEGALKEGQIYRLQIRLVDKSEPEKKQLLELFIPAWRADNATQEGITQPLDETELAGRKEHAQSTLQPWLCGHEIGEMLDISEGTPIFRNEWVHYLRDGRIASVSETYITANALVRNFEWGV
ncbi:MAG: GntR family transcriptional regulator [Desulfobacterales bacterium]